MKETTPSTTRTKRNWGLLLPGLLFTAFSLFFSYAIYWSHQQQADASVNFLPVSAQILDSRIVQTRAHVSGKTSSNLSYTLQVHYQYQVDGTSYQSTRFSYLGDAYDSQETAQQVLNHYPIGSTQTAYYHPNNPSEAVLIKSMSSTPA